MSMKKDAAGTNRVLEKVSAFLKRKNIVFSAKRYGNAQPLAHTEREVPRPFSPRIRQPHKLQQLVYSVKGRQPEDAVLLLKIVPCGQRRVNRGRFHHRTHAPARFCYRAACAVNPVERIRTACGALQTAYSADGLTPVKRNLCNMAGNMQASAA